MAELDRIEIATTAPGAKEAADALNQAAEATGKVVAANKENTKELSAGAQAMKDFRLRQKEVRGELLGLEKGTDAYKEKIKELGSMIDRAGDRMKEARAASDDWDETLGRMVSTAANVGRTVTSGFQAIKGVQMLLGNDTKNLEKQMQTLFTLMATTQAFSAFASGITKVIQQMKLLRASMAANPITAWVTGLTALAAAVTAFFATGGADKLRSWFTGVETDAQKAKREADRLAASIKALDDAGLSDTPWAVNLKIQKLQVELRALDSELDRLEKKQSKGGGFWARFLKSEGWKIDDVTAKEIAENIDKTLTKNLEKIKLDAGKIIDPQKSKASMLAAMNALLAQYKDNEVAVKSDIYKGIQSSAQELSDELGRQAAKTAKNGLKGVPALTAEQIDKIFDDMDKRIAERAAKSKAIGDEINKSIQKASQAEEEPVDDIQTMGQVAKSALGSLNSALLEQNASQEQQLQSRLAFYEQWKDAEGLSNQERIEMSDAYYETKNALDEVATAKEEENWQKRAAAAQQSLQSIGSVLGSLADLYQQQADQAEEGSAEQEKLMKEAKNMQIAQAIINGLAGAVGVFAQSAAQGGIPGMIAGAIAAASLLVTTGIQIKQIEETDISRKKKAAAKAAKKPPKAPNAQALTPQMNVTRQQGFEREQLNQTANVSRQAEAMQDRRVYILESDLQASNNNVRARVRETTF